MNNKLLYTLISLALLMLNTCNAPNESSVKSPGKKTRVQFALHHYTPYYLVYHQNRLVLPASRLGFELKDAPGLKQGFQVDSIIHSTFDETWEPVWGEVAQIRNHYNEMKVFLREKETPNRKLNIIFRVYDDGIGFRYEFPEQENLGDFVVMDELTEFNLNDNPTLWWIPGDFDSYEHLYRETDMDEATHVNTPVTMKTNDGLYLSIHEAALMDYPEMTLKKDSAAYKYMAGLAPWADGTKARLCTPFKTPWRTIQIGEKPGDLIESHLILNLNDPCVYQDVSWIKPMKYAGIWWGMHIGYNTWGAGERHGATTDEAKRYIDFCATQNIPGLLIEGWNTGWESWFAGNNFDFVTPYDDFDLDEVVRYGKEKGVEIIGHHETGGQVPMYERHMENAFKRYHSLGIQAVKTGYAGKIRPGGENHHGQFMVRHHQKVIDTAAKYQIMIDAHEPIKPTGLRRTYPNFMTREGVRGMEYNAWSEGNPPEHTCILPFTRMLAGPLDYTPGIFDITYERYRKELSTWHEAHDETPKRVHTTLAKQLALYVILYSPMQMAADLPENYEGHAAFEFIRHAPVDWDETRVLNGEIGDYITIARKNGDRWFIGSITDENQREIEIRLDFLDPGKDYVALVYSDAENTDLETNPTAFKFDMFPVTSENVLVMGLAAGGGQAIEIRPVEEK